MRFKNLVTFCYLTILPNIAHCQLDTSAVLSKVSRNFLLYRILGASGYIESFTSHDGYLSSTTDIHFLNYLPGDNCKLEIDLAKRPYEFPDSNFKVFEVVKKRGLYLCAHTRMAGELYPPTKDFRMLIAVHIRTNQVIFISGNFFLQDIRHYFDLDNQIKHFEWYLELREFMYGIDKVRFRSKRGRQYYFDGFNSEGDTFTIKAKYRRGSIESIELWAGK